MLSSPSVEIIIGLNINAPAARYPKIFVSNRQSDMQTSNTMVSDRIPADS